MSEIIAAATLTMSLIAGTISILYIFTKMYLDT